MIGCRILSRTRAVDLSIAREFLSLPVANVSDCMSRLTSGGAAMRPMHARPPRMAGPAFTVKTRPGDNLFFLKALELAKPGDIIVVDGGGDLTNALAGEMMVADAHQLGLGGFVINGAIRDADGVRAGNFPVFAVGVTHRGPYKDGPGEINVPVAINGMVIEPGDLVLGDADGTLCVPFDEVTQVLAAARKRQQMEQRIAEQILTGTLDRGWIDARLREIGCDIGS
jgi:regulator of RNase E activity RraA